MTTPTPMISLAQVNAIRAALTELPPKEKTQLTSREAIAAMAEEIRRARTELGYSLEDIAAMLQPHGLAVRPSTLRGYLRALEKEADEARAASAVAQPTRRTRARRSAPAAPPAPAEPRGIVWEEIPELDPHERGTVHTFMEEPPHG